MAITAIVIGGAYVASSVGLGIASMENKRIAAEKAQKTSEEMVSAQNAQTDQLKKQQEEAKAAQDAATKQAQDREASAAVAETVRSSRVGKRSRGAASYGGTLLTGPKGLSSTPTTEKTLLGS